MTTQTEIPLPKIAGPPKIKKKRKRKVLGRIKVDINGQQTIFEMRPGKGVWVHWHGNKTENIASFQEIYDRAVKQLPLNGM